MLKKTFSANHTKSLVLSYEDDMRRAMKIAVMTTHTHCHRGNELLPFGILILAYSASVVKVVCYDLYACTILKFRIVQRYKSLFSVILI